MPLLVHAPPPVLRASPPPASTAAPSFRLIQSADVSPPHTAVQPGSIPAHDRRAAPDTRPSAGFGNRVETTAGVGQLPHPIAWSRWAELAGLCAVSAAALGGYPAWAASLGAATLMLGYAAGDASPTAIAMLAALAAVGWLHRQRMSESLLAPWTEGLLCVGLAGASLWRLPGLTRTVFSTPMMLRPCGTPFYPSMNVDKTLAASIVLCAISLPRGAAGGLKTAIGAAALPTAALIALMLGPALASGHVAFDPAFPPCASLWLLHNLFLVAVPEETLFRGILPRLLSQLPGTDRLGPWGILALSSILFGAAHYRGGSTYVALSALAGVGYGLCAMRAGGLGGSILAHVALNTTHFFLFTYPALAR